MNFNGLRVKHPRFIYEGFEITQDGSDLKISFDFRIEPDIKFNTVVVFSNVSKKEGLETLVFNLGMVELLSYWKTTCSPTIVVKAGFLDEEQINFWKKLLIKGLGEFFYTNQIDFTKSDLVKFVIASEATQSQKEIASSRTPRNDVILKDRDLILVGGGKDSAVTLEKIADSEKEFNCLMLNPTDASLKISEAGGAKNPLIIKRTIDRKLLELNREGYLNGHTPLSAYLAFLSAIAGVLYDYKNLVVSNESSSNEMNTLWNGHEINHQYSKTSEFEKDFKEYSQKYLAPVNYYSYLRQYGELEISQMFSEMEKYHKLFRSCNRGSKKGVWCGECPKCVSTFITLYPYLGEKTIDIFGKNLLQDKKLKPIIEGLLGKNNSVKPFECVATYQEIKKALDLVGYETDESILILGMGREGKATLNYFQKNFPSKKIETADKLDGENYLDKIKDFDVIIKSPGIPNFPEIKEARKMGKVVTSATSIFFGNFKGKIIGITGTKGKSTTASLIYEVLKAGGIDTHLVGNIGKPALDLLGEINENSIVVFELSSFQLEDLEVSPHIAVITNIYPDHLDYHGSFEEYKKAKENIFKYQTADDILIRKSGAECARIIGKIFNIADEKIEEAINNFKGLPHRLEFVAEINGVKFYNDSLATNPHATIFGLEKLGDEIETLIAGGFDRGLDFSNLSDAINNSNIKNLILFPTTGEKIAKGISDKKNIFNVSNMKEAVDLAFGKTTPGKIVLLSPASASFNLFKDYEDRGNQFKEMVSLYK